ncbi:hypothetical protein IWX47DRAFT_92596 [Phyllosticta citricarpa]|uniref:Uncharacterized protein n=1 Tax=Phyllosticta citricarpa TaxID=55181 RepID=A0ABR1M049_9PEZI
MRCRCIVTCSKRQINWSTAAVGACFKLRWGARAGRAAMGHSAVAQHQSAGIQVCPSRRAYPLGLGGRSTVYLQPCLPPVACLDVNSRWSCQATTYLSLSILPRPTPAPFFPKHCLSTLLLRIALRASLSSPSAVSPTVATPRTRAAAVSILSSTTSRLVCCSPQSSPENAVRLFIPTTQT